MAPPKTKKVIQLIRMQPGTGNEEFRETARHHIERTTQGVEVTDLKNGSMCFYPWHMVKLVQYVTPTAPAQEPAPQQDMGQETPPS